MKMHGYSPLGADPRCEYCGLSEGHGNHTIVVGGGMVKDEKSKQRDGMLEQIMNTPPVIEEIRMPERGPEFFMTIQLDRARIGLKLLDEGDDAKTTTCFTYPGIPITRTVDLEKGNYHYHAMQEVFLGDIVEYLTIHGVKAELIL